MSSESDEVCELLLGTLNCRNETAGGVGTAGKQHRTAQNGSNSFQFAPSQFAVTNPCSTWLVMLDVSKIAFFLLSTAGLNGFAEQKYPTFFDSRTLPIKQTWGAFFPHLHFVFGNNPADYRFLQKRCTLERTIGEPINPSAKQTLVRNATDLYSCPVTPSEWKWNASQPISSPYTSPVLQAYNSFAANRLAPLRALYHANCSGKYFGLGPSCRCQESMRYYLTEPAFRDFDWFVFMDDDLYFRPYALLSFLDRVQRNTSLSSQPLAMIAGSGLQGFRQLKNKALASGHHDCTHQVVYRFGYAQPAFFNRKTMTKLSLAVHSNAMTGLHKYWGGSHDSLLGMLLWMHGIPTYSILK